MRQGRLEPRAASKGLCSLAVAAVALGSIACGPSPAYEVEIERRPSSWTPPLDDFAIPFAMGQTWYGKYDCPQGLTTLAVHVVDVDGGNVKALFDFDHEASGAKGLFEMSGQWRIERREMDFKPGRWIKRPPGYETVGMQGVVSLDGRHYKGIIAHEACGDFALNLLPR